MRERIRRYRQTVAAVLAVLTAVDPYGLEPGTPEGPPADEYEPEAVDLARVLLAEGAVTVRDVEDVWAHWFSESLVLRLGVDRTARLVDELNALSPAQGRVACHFAGPDGVQRPAKGQLGRRSP